FAPHRPSARCSGTYVASGGAGGTQSGTPPARSATAAGRPASEIADAVNRVFALFQAHWPRKFSSIWPTAHAVANSKASAALAVRQMLENFRGQRRSGRDEVRDAISDVDDTSWSSGL